MRPKKKAQYLLKIVDGFIYVNYSINFESVNKEIFKLIYDSIKERNNFSFNNCLFILNKIDEGENKDIELEKTTEDILKIFDEQNNDVDSIKVLDLNERIQVKSLILTPFSCTRYEEYKKKESSINDFEGFIKENMDNNNNKSKNILTTLKNNLNNKLNKWFENEIKTNSINQFDEYCTKLRNLLNIPNNKSDKELREIIQLYFNIKYNLKNMKLYNLCYIELLLHQFKMVIEKTFVFFKIKLQNDALFFIVKSYEELLNFYFITKLRMSDDNIDKFKQLDKEAILDSINEKEMETKNNLNEIFDEKEKIIKDNIYYCKPYQSDFEYMLNSNQRYLKDELIKNVIRMNNKFDSFLKKKMMKLLRN